MRGFFGQADKCQHTTTGPAASCEGADGLHLVLTRSYKIVTEVSVSCSTWGGLSEQNWAMQFSASSE